jgi:hypothetical protein
VALRAVPNLPINDQLGLIKLFPGLLSLLAENLDVLRTTLSLMDSYMLLAGQDLMQAYGPQVIQAYATALSQVPKESARSVLESLEIVIRVSDPSIWIPLFVSTGLAQKTCEIIDDPKTSGPELAAYDTLLSRVILLQATAFATLVQAFAQTQVTKGDVAKQLELTIDAMWRAYEYVGDVRRRKMVAMGFAELLLLVSIVTCLQMPLNSRNFSVSRAKDLYLSTWKESLVRSSSNLLRSHSLTIALQLTHGSTRWARSKRLPATVKSTSHHAYNLCRDH